MSEVTLAQVKQLADQLSTDDRLTLVEHIAKSLRLAPRSSGKPQSLRGIWRAHFPKDFDVDAPLHEIRHGWEKEWPEDARQ